MATALRSRGGVPRLRPPRLERADRQPPFADAAAHPDDDPPQFLVNPRGLLFQEITASSLIVCDLDGRVLRGQGELRRVAFHIHARIHVRNPAATCVLHVHPQYLTALSMLEAPEFALAHTNNLYLNDRMVVDNDGGRPVLDNEEGDRIADLLGDATILVMGGHGVTTVGPTVEEAFDELHSAERTCMYQMTAMATGQPLRRLPSSCATATGDGGRCAPTRGCSSMRGGGCWIGRNPTTRHEKRAGDRSPAPVRRLCQAAIMRPAIMPPGRSAPWPRRSPPASAPVPR